MAQVAVDVATRTDITELKRYLSESHHGLSAEIQGQYCQTHTGCQHPIATILDKKVILVGNDTFSLKISENHKRSRI